MASSANPWWSAPNSDAPMPLSLFDLQGFLLRLLLLGPTLLILLHRRFHPFGQVSFKPLLFSA